MAKRHGGAAALPDLEYSEAGDAMPPLRQQLALSRLEKEEFESTSFDDWVREADQVIRRSQAILDRLTQPAQLPAPQPDAA